MNNLISQLMSIKNPDAFYQKLISTNPQFAKFIQDNKGKTPEQIAKENNVDPRILNLFR